MLPVSISANDFRMFYVLKRIIVLRGALELVRKSTKQRYQQAIPHNKHGPTARKVSRTVALQTTFKFASETQIYREWSKPDPLLTLHV